MALRAGICLVMVGVISGCAVADGQNREAVPCEVPDAGLTDDDILDGGGDFAIVDAGFCIDGLPVLELSPDAPDSGAEQGDVDACEVLVVASCGLSRECERDPGCVAAELLAKHEPERCADVAGDARSFPPCALGTCALLATKVCGGDAPAACEDAPGCPPVRELASRAEGGDVSADDACAQALADETLFPNCL